MIATDAQFSILKILAREMDFVDSRRIRNELSIPRTEEARFGRILNGLFRKDYVIRERVPMHSLYKWKITSKGLDLLYQTSDFYRVT